MLELGWAGFFKFCGLGWVQICTVGYTLVLSDVLCVIKDCCKMNIRYCVTGTRRCDHITPVLRLLHWLPVRQRVDFQVATLVRRSLSENSASYLADDCRLVADARERRLRSTESRTCVVTRTLHSIFGDRAFAAAGPGLWNSLPPHLRDADLPYSRFRRSLKTFLFG